MSVHKLKKFPQIRVEYIVENVTDTDVNAIYQRYMVCANGFIIATFVDETSMNSYLDYLKKYSFHKFPKQVMDIILAGYENTTIRDVIKNNK